ncbi:hypothetical protein B0T22DRAFT_83142 [Podospora appendiculata]|uniref:RRM domain-containing protein n=1 Tax=Podospora appendiculata TaxID=314037 RepID=A0AAE1CHH0_9PEZI|nr:hypothetical protein B0T22DRAFT_83142 [Podospora appendiculata]
MPRSNLSTSNSPYAAKSGPRTVSGPVIVNGTVFSRWTPEQALRRASENQKRAAMKDAPKETCDHPAVEQEQGKKGHHPSKSGPVPMDHEFRSAGEGVEKAGPSRLPRIASHNPNGLSVPPAVVEPTEPVAATAQNSESSQPDKARHSAEEPKVLETQTALSCQTSAAPTEKDRQPNGNSHSHSHSHGHEHEHKHKPTASVETITSGWSTTRHDDLHGPVMQHRISVRKSSGPGTAAPKSTVAAHDFPKGSAADHEGQENSSPSQDVSTSDIASQKVPETSGSGQEARKNSLPHGHEPRTSTAGQYTQPPRVPFSPTSMVACKNIDKRMHDPFYEECPCLRCVESSRTVFVTIRDDSNMPKLDPQARLDAIGHCFGRWGRVEMVQPRRQQDWSKDFFNVYVRFSTENSALEAIKAANMQPGPALRIPLVTNRLLAWFPYYSKHFRPKPSRFHGRHSMSFQIPQARPGREAAASQPPFRNSSTGSVYEAQMQQQHGLQPRPQPLLQQTVQEHPVHQQHIAQQPVPQQPVKQQSPFQQQHVQQEHIQQQQATQEQQIQHHQPVQQQQRQSVQQQHIQHHQHAQQQHYKRQHNQHHQSVQKQQQPVQEQHTQHHQPAQQQQSVQKQQYMQKQQQQQKQPGNKQPQHGRKVTNRMSQHHANPQAPPYTPGLQSPAIVYRRRDSLPPPFPSATGQPHPFTDVPPFMGGNTGSVDNLDMMQPGQVPPGQFYPLAYPPPPQPPPFPVGYTHAPPPGMPFVPVAGPPGQPIQPGLQPGQPGQPGHPGQPVQVVPHAQFYPGAVPFYPQMPVFPHGGVVYTPISYPYFPPGVNGTPAGHLVPVDHQPYQQQGHFPTPPGQQDGQTAQHHRLPPPQIQPFTMTPRMAVSQPLTRNFSDWAPDGKPIREFPLETPTRSGPPKGPRLVHQASGAKASTSAVNATTQKMASSSSDLAPQEAGQDQELDVEDHGTAIRRKPRQNPGLPAQWVDRGYSAGPSDQATRETSPEAFGPQTQPQDGPSQSVEKKKSKHKSKKKKNQNSNQSSSNSCAAIAPLGHPQAAQDKGKEAETALDVATGAGFDNNRKDRSQTVASRPTNPATLDSGSRTQKDKGLKAASKSDAKPKGNEEGIRVSASRPSTPSDSVDNFQPVQSHEADAKNDTTPKATAQVVGKDTDNDATPKAPAQVVRHDTGDDGALEAPAQVPDQSQPKKKGKNNKSKRGTKAGNDPSVTAEKAADQPSNEPLQSLDSRDTSPDRKQNPQLSVDQPYRAEAGGSLRIRRNRSKGPTLKSAFATSEPMAKDSEDKELPVEAAECPVAANKEVTLRDQNIHGSFKNLPKQFNAWPRQGDGKIWVPPPLAAQSKVTTPKVVVEHVETVKQRDTSTATDSDGLQLCSRKPSASSATLSHRTSE